MEKTCNVSIVIKHSNIKAIGHLTTLGIMQNQPKPFAPKCPPALKQKFISCGGIMPTRMSYMEILVTGGPGGGMGAICSSQLGQNNLADGSTPDVHVLAFEPSQSQAEPSMAASNTLRSSGLRQQHMNEAYYIAKRKQLDEKWATFFYEANVAFTIVQHPLFVAAVRATSQARFDYDPPSYHAMRTTLIKSRRKHVEEEVKKATKQSIEIYGATICTDGWDNVTRRPLMNIMLSCPTGDIFLGSIDTTGNKKTKVYTATELKKFIDAVGPRFVTQICTNNATNMLGTMDNIVATYPHIFKQGYDAHTLDLMLED
jgi:hypothetical protein